MVGPGVPKPCFPGVEGLLSHQVSRDGGWGSVYKIGSLWQIESTLEALGSSEAPQAARLWLRVTPAPAVTAVYQCAPGPGPPGETWALMETSVAPRAGKVLATAEKVVVAWEKVVAAQTFLTLSSSLSIPEAGW